MDKNEVNEAFEILLEEIEAVANELNEDGASAFQAGNYEKARQTIEEATRLAEFHEKVRSLQKEWAALFARHGHPRRKPTRRKRKGRLPRGLRTTEDAFRKPILEALVELGGSAPMRKVLARVEQKMRGILNEYDYQPLPSDPRSVRWRNTAQWCRNTLVREGLMKSDFPHGIWEISEAGQQSLKSNE